MNSKFKLIFTSMFLLAALVGMTGCSGANAECQVKAGKGAFPQIIVNPPGETGEAEISCKVSKQTSITPGMSSSTYTGECTQIYEESGNTYTIDVNNIAIVGNRLESYWLGVTGGVYGETPFVCTYP